ncbi:MAG: serine/threonine protein kinase [Planctomycetes bacterium]|nr:serine/threonine protein kinase [Planctomycetota bacterium]
MIRVGQRLGKYRLKRRLARGGFADVFEAYDTLERVRVALKVPLGGKLDAALQTDFEREIQVSAKLDHPNILTLKNADVIDGCLTIAYPMGEGSLDDRLSYRMSTPKALDLAEQLIAALAYAHEHRVIHCDVKPDNLILFPDGGLRLGDFGLAKHSVRTLQASSSGTPGYMAPEQAMGRPSARSDVFSAGLIIYRMLAGKLPEWPYKWPMPGLDRLRRSVPDVVPFLQRALKLEARSRFRDGAHMLEAFREAKRLTLRRLERRKHKRR